MTKRSEGLLKAPDEIVEQFNEIFLSFDGKEKKINETEISLEHSLSKDIETIYEFARKQKFTKEHKGAYIGGDHTISYALIKAFMEKHPEGKVLVFDAHPDVESDFFISHEDYLRNLIPLLLKPQQVMLIGIRNMSKEELAFLKMHKIRYFSALDVFENLNKIISETKKFCKDCYLSFDIDAIDPAFAPATGYIEPFGLLPYQVLKIINAVKQEVIECDIVEVNSEKDINNMTAKLAARIIYEIL